MFDLSGKRALVTGAGQGIGAGIARALGKQGASVVVNDLQAQRALRTAVKLHGDGIEASTAVFDVAEHNAVASAIADHGPVDILVNNAGIPAAMELRKFRDSSPRDWAPYLSVNLLGVMNCCHAVVKPMRERGWGRIITISSTAGTTGAAIGVAAYGAGKGGGIGFMRNLALEEAGSGITANTLALGLMAKSRERAMSDRMARVARTIPCGRLGTPGDAAALCVYLASAEASWITGQTIGLNGGLHTT